MLKETTSCENEIKLETIPYEEYLKQQTETFKSYLTNKDKQKELTDAAIPQTPEHEEWLYQMLVKPMDNQELSVINTSAQFMLSAIAALGVWPCDLDNKVYKVSKRCQLQAQKKCQQILQYFQNSTQDQIDKDAAAYNKKRNEQ